MKVGVPTFGYQHFAPFVSQHAENGFFTANIGDNMQSIAVRLLLQRLGVPAEDIVSVNRDTLRDYAGPPVAVVMNGVFLDWSFPLPENVRPIFIGFNTNEQTIAKFRDFFAKNEPIGCRDRATADLFLEHRIQAHVTGCLTLSIPPRTRAPQAGKVLAIYGGVYNSGVGEFPASVLKGMPSEYFDSLQFVSQRIPCMDYPLSAARCLEIEKYTKNLLDYYAANAKLAITPLHHAATPCMALGIPVILCRKAFDPRFSYLAELLPIYTTDSFHTIDWNPSPIDVEPIRRRLEQLVRDSFRALSL